MTLKKKDKVVLDRLVDDFRKKFGNTAIAYASERKQKRVISTGVLGLDYKLQTGGWVMGECAVVYAPADIGKTSSIGYGAIIEAQKKGLVCALIAVEPTFDPDWAESLGVDLNSLLLARPATGEEAVATIKEFVGSGVIDLVVFDSIGAMISEGEIDVDGKPRPGGQSQLITHMVKSIAPLAYRNDVAVLYINQVRANMSARVPGVLQMPGGHALEHACAVWLRLRPKEAFKQKINGDDVIVAREIAAIIERNKGGEGTNAKALYTFTQARYEGGPPLGIDRFEDVLSTSILTGVIKQGGAYFTLPAGMTDRAIQGRTKVKEFLSEHPEHIEKLRELVLEKM